MDKFKFKPGQLVKYTYNGDERFLAIVICVDSATVEDHTIIRYLRVAELSRNNGFRMGGIGSADSRYLSLIS